MASIWDFLGGAADTQLKTMEAREQTDRELKKAEFLEKLRRETSDYEFARNKAYEEKLTDPQQSYADYDKGVFVLVNKQGTKIGERPLTSTEVALGKQEVEKGGLDIAHKRAQIEDIGIDNAISRGHLSVAQANAATARRGSIEGAGDPKMARLYAMANMVTNNLAKQGLPTPDVAQARKEVLDRIENGGWVESDVRRFEGEMLKQPYVQQMIRFNNKIGVASSEVGSPRKK